MASVFVPSVDLVARADAMADRGIRLHLLRKRLDEHVEGSAWRTPIGVAWSLLVLAAHSDDDLCFAALVVTVVGGLGGMVDTTVASPLSGRRIVRLRYDWDEIAPILPANRDKLVDALAPFAAPGGVLRARVRHARHVGATR